MPTDAVNKSSIINPLQVGRTKDASAATKARDAKDGAAAKGRADNAGVNVALSPKAREMANARAKATEIARNTPDVREDRVAALKKQVQEGTYKVDAGNIADGIMREAIKERLAELEEK